MLHAYIPDIYGKERRKASPGREGKLGVEGVEARLIVAALQKAGARSRAQDGPGAVTTATLYEDGLLGAPNSAALRRRLAKSLGLPERLSASALLDALNLLLTEPQYRQAVRAVKEEGQP